MELEIYWDGAMRKIRVDAQDPEEWEAVGWEKPVQYDELCLIQIAILDTIDYIYELDAAHAYYERVNGWV